MAKSSNPMDDAVSAENQNGRQSMGNEATHFTAAAPKSGKLVAKKGAQAGDPTGAGTAQHRKMTEKHGAAYSVGSRYMKQNEPSAGATQANGRIIPAVMQRQAPNFQSGMGDSY
jgi:hypothetical protein